MPDVVAPDRVSLVFDRTRSLFDLPSIESITPLGTLCQPKAIDQLFFDRAQHIISSAADKKIMIAWSGGIDSTSVLVEFLKLVPKDKLVILMNESSIAEYPIFYDRYIKGQIETRELNIYNANVIQQSLADCILVTGSTFDQTFGDEDYIHRTPYFLKQSLDMFMSNLNSYTYDSYTRLISACPRKIESVKDFCWWFCYAVCYQNEQNMWLIEAEDLIPEINVFHFPANQDWNNWSVSTPIEVKYPGYDFRNFKIELKKHIYEFTKDSDYYENKIKMPSYKTVRNTKQKREQPLYITTDWKRGYNI